MLKTETYAPVNTPDFTAWIDRHFRRYGLHREVTVRLTQEGLELTDTKGGRYVIRPAEIERLRAGIDKVRGGPFFETRIWLKGAKKPVKLITRRYHLHGYTPAIRGLAARLELSQLETGTSKADRNLTIGLLVIPLLFAIAIWAGPLHEKPLWQGLTVVTIPALALIAVIFDSRRSKPAPIVSREAFYQAVNAGFSE